MFIILLNFMIKCVFKKMDNKKIRYAIVTGLFEHPF